MRSWARPQRGALRDSGPGPSWSGGWFSAAASRYGPVLQSTIQSGAGRSVEFYPEALDSLRFSVRQEIPQIKSLAFSVEYRLENDITREDDFTFGAEFRDWSMTVGKHGVVSLSYARLLQPPAS